VSHRAQVSAEWADAIAAAMRTLNDRLALEAAAGLSLDPAASSPAGGPAAGGPPAGGGPRLAKRLSSASPSSAAASLPPALSPVAASAADSPARGEVYYF
jgi:hypothetical protein